MQLLIIAVLGNYLIPAMDGYPRLCSILFLISCGVGNGCGAVTLRFGSKAGMIIYIVMIFLVAGVVSVIGALSSFDAVLPFINSAGVFAVGAVFDVIMAVAFYFGVRRYEVRI